ncbi:hypothetical protein V6N13_058046 [Hibiscus sabdariffa]|uniref:Uncharacterized protein n=1 Tax=Hibiscus sabdariffa TaxID=183260 RepID=A0ABR2GHD2_9ROSI
MSVSLKWNIMKIWAVFLLYVPCSSPFAILSLKTVVEYATSDNGAVIESIAGIFTTTVALRALYSLIYAHIHNLIEAAVGLTYVT